MLHESMQRAQQENLTTEGMRYILHAGLGLALGGGIGLSMRQHGLTCDRILGADIVIANGSLV